MTCITFFKRPTHLPLAPSVLILAGTLCQKIESLAGIFAPPVHRQLSKTHLPKSWNDNIKSWGYGGFQFLFSHGCIVACFKWCKISLKGRKVNSTFDRFWGEHECLWAGAEACTYRLLPCPQIGVYVCMGVCVCSIDLVFWSMDDDPWTPRSMIYRRWNMFYLL